MRSFQKKGELKYIMQSKPFLVFLGIVILFFFFSMLSFVEKLEDTRQNRNIIENKIAELEASKEKFNADIEKLKTERGVEESIREKFGLAKEGESMILVVDEKGAEGGEEETDSSGFVDFFKSLFK